MVRNGGLPWTGISNGVPLSNAAAFLRGFETVVSLNYDLIAYWIMMHSNDQHDWHRFKDAFHDGQFVKRWDEYRHTINDEKYCTIFCYPHGNFALVEGPEASAVKLSAKPDELARTNLSDVIDLAWKEGRIPMFVAEGKTDQKREAIERNSYLRAVLTEMLPDAARASVPPRRLVFLGWSIGKNEDHILQGLALSNVEKIAISVAADSTEKRLSELEGRLREFNFEGKVDWFDYASPGCWINSS